MHVVEQTEYPVYNGKHNGNCKEAVERYISVFGGQIYHISFWGQENCDESSRWGKVMHKEVWDEKYPRALNRWYDNWDAICP